MDWNREVDRAVISEVPIEDILQIKREHITEPVKRSIERYGNKPEMHLAYPEYGNSRAGTAYHKGA